MRKRLFFLIFIIILLTSFIISLIIGAFSYDFVKTVFRENKEEKIDRIEKQFVSYNKILSSMEKEMDFCGGRSLKALALKYPDIRSIASSSPESLLAIAAKTGVSEVYFIGRDGVVFNSSLKSDIGLNLYNVSAGFKKYLESIAGSGRIVSQGLSVSVVKGKINHYMYYSPAGSNIIYEISMDVPAYVKKKYDLALYEFLFGDMFKNFYNEYLKSVDLFSIAGDRGWSIIHEGKSFDGPDYLVGEILKKGSAEIKKNNRIYIYKKLQNSSYFFNRTTDVYLEMVYDIGILSSYLRNIFIFSIASGLLISLVLFLIAIKRLDSILLGRLIDISNSLARIRSGDYGLSISDDAGDEISDIAANITVMSRDLRQRSIDLNSSNEQLRDLSIYINSIIESMPSILISIDEKERVIHWNRETVEFTGKSAADASGKLLWDVFPSLKKYRSEIEQVKDKRTAIELHREFFIKENEGFSQFIKNIYIFPFDRKQISGLIIRIDDITELETKQQQLDRAGKVEILGTMAGGLAHDFNNIISVIISAVSYMDLILSEEGTLSDSELTANLDVIRKAGEKATRLVKNLMSFATSERAVFETINLSRLIREMVDISSPVINGKIDIVFNHSDLNATIAGVKSQIEQVMLNLIVNASDAIRSKLTADNTRGMIRILLEKVEADNDRFNTAMWHIAVEDNGGGIDSSKVSRVFDPLFTTKEKGSGLGLAIVNNVVNSHGGTVEVISEEGLWTRFSIYLPSA